MKRIGFILSVILIVSSNGYSQVEKPANAKILFSGIVRDASTLAPLPNSQILINRSFVSASDEEGTFAIRVSRNDTVVFSLLGYQSVCFSLSDTLTGTEFMAGVYMSTDTVSIGEVIIMPRLVNLKSDILKTPPSTSAEMENAKYNMAVSAYQGRIAMSKLDDPSTHYSVLQNRQFINASIREEYLPVNCMALSPFITHSCSLSSDIWIS